LVINHQKGETFSVYEQNCTEGKIRLRHKASIFFEQHSKSGAPAGLPRRLQVLSQLFEGERAVQHLQKSAGLMRVQLLFGQEAHILPDTLSCPHFMSVLLCLHLSRLALFCLSLLFLSVCIYIYSS
jgi:hypothetical protein